MVDKYTKDWKAAHQKVKYALEWAKAKQNKAVDCHKQPFEFSLGDWVQPWF